MTNNTNESILVRLVSALRENGNWCGTVHVQKAAYLLQELCGQPLGVEFVLYKDGPFSFDLSDQLASLHAYDVLELEPSPPYGPRLRLGAGTAAPEGVTKEWEEAISFVATHVGSKDIKKLEGLTTALFLAKRDYAKSNNLALAERLHQLKPHIPLTAAIEFVAEMNGLRQSLEARPCRYGQRENRRAACQAAL